MEMGMEMDLSQIEYDKFCTTFHSSTTITLNNTNLCLSHLFSAHTPISRTPLPDGYKLHNFEYSYKP